MYEPEPKMPLHLGSRATRLGDLAEALYWAIDGSGLRLPARRDIAGHARVSEATISRRFRDTRGGEERVAAVLASARDRTYPPQWGERGWPRWVPESDLELRDVRAWLACLAVATHAPSVAEAVRLAWEHEHAVVVATLTGDVASPHDEPDAEVASDAEVVQALLLGLSIRRLLDPEVTWDRASMLLRRVVGALGYDPAP